MDSPRKSAAAEAKAQELKRSQLIPEIMRVTKRRPVIRNSRRDRLKKARFFAPLALLLEGLDLACIDLYDQYHATPLFRSKGISDVTFYKIIKKQQSKIDRQQ